MLTTVVRDSVTFTLKEADLTGKKVGEDLLTPKRDIPNAHGLQWWLQWYPAGKTQEDRGSVSIYLWVNKPVKGEFTFSNDCFKTRKADTHELTYGSLCNGQNKYASHKKLSVHFDDGELVIKCGVKFDILPVHPIHDAATFTLNEADLTGKNVGDKLKTPKRDVPCSDGLQWWIVWYPAGDRETAKGHVSVFLRVNKPVTVKYTFAVDSSSISWTFTFEFADAPEGRGWPKYSSHEQLRPLFRDGKLTITCSAEFTSSIQSIPASPAVYEVFDHTPPDFDLIIDSKRIPVHKNYLSVITPVYCRMFENGKFHLKPEIL